MFEIERTNERSRFVQIDLVNIEEKMLDFEYGVNTGNRFLQFVDHDEEPEAFIAAQTKSDSASNVPVPAATMMKKKSTTNKENLTSKTSNERRANATTVFNDQQNQSTRQDSTRGSRGAGRRAAANSARSQRFQKSDGTSNTNDESSSARARRGRGAMSNRTATHSFVQSSSLKVFFSNHWISLDLRQSPWKTIFHLKIDPSNPIAIDECIEAMFVFEFLVKERR